MARKPWVEYTAAFYPCDMPWQLAPGDLPQRFDDCSLNTQVVSDFRGRGVRTLVAFSSPNVSKLFRFGAFAAF
jgi:hypothetical protein